MKHAPLYAFAALLALSACSERTPQEADANAAAANDTAAATPVELPPAIKEEATLRCRDNSLVYVTFFQGDRQALVRTERNGDPTTLRAAAAGEPLTAEGGYSMTGTPESVELTLPGKDAQTCRA